MTRPVDVRGQDRWILVDTGGPDPALLAHLGTVPGRRRWDPQRRLWHLERTGQTLNALLACPGATFHVDPALTPLISVPCRAVRPADGRATRESPRRPDRSASSTPRPRPSRKTAALVLERMSDELRLRGYTPRTRKAYVKQMRRFLEAEPEAAEELRPDHIRRYLLHLDARGTSVSYRHQAISALRFAARLFGHPEVPGAVRKMSRRTPPPRDAGGGRHALEDGALGSCRGLVGGVTLPGRRRGRSSPRASLTRGGPMGTGDFYDDLADLYDLIYADWEAARKRQLSSLLTGFDLAGLAARPRVLDAAAGIGTQSLPLAEHGCRVSARDLSAGAIARLERDAGSEGVVIDAGVCSMTEVASSVSGRFDAILALDNSLPHLLSDDEISRALGQFRCLLEDDGAVFISVRDYHALDRTTTRLEYGERTRGGRRFRLHQEWTWTGPEHYDTEMVIAEDEGVSWREVVRTRASYYAIPLRRVIRLMEDAGFRVERIDPEVGFFQPLLLGRLT